jgi:hypothetical protein
MKLDKFFAARTKPVLQLGWVIPNYFSCSLVAMPAGETIAIARLKIHLVRDPIRNDPGFQQLLAEDKELVGPNK